MTDHAIMRLQAGDRANRQPPAHRSRPVAAARELRQGEPSGRRLDSRAAAHADIRRLLGDATGGSAYALLAQLISGSVRDMITWAGPDAENLITAARRRLTRRVEERDADGAAREMERFLALLSLSRARSAEAELCAGR